MLKDIFLCIPVIYRQGKLSFFLYPNFLTKVQEVYVLTIFILD